ncbi:MAG: right-handed parallel beta-helix repeat-containing protein [Clostridia bacterium]|nr:right-handed parallel beta-helix repeat-containing protein [Clostridia bacterium]
MAREYHVAKNGCDKALGTAENPFLTISRAARVADEGDTVIVHEGVYREYVSPENGARSELHRITYTAAEGEHVVIKGSEIVSGWVSCGAYWRTVVSNTLFGAYNPYSEPIDGDWLVRPLDPPCHTGMVYLDGEPLMEAHALDTLNASVMYWYAEVLDEETVLYANFGDHDPNASLTEINVRRSCFCPEKTGRNYITVRGFEMAQAATPWSPPTADQVGLLGVHWSKGWIIEDNIIHDSRCCGISVGKEISTGHNQYTKTLAKAGGHYQFEAMFAGLRMGWSRETIGSHIIRNNLIYNCGQNGIVGHMGGAYSDIYGNEIHHVADRQEFFGYELGGIKLHAPIDTQIHHNHIHDCIMGTWLDWQAQGTRLYANVYHHNTIDIKIEVTHGPHLVDNNIFGSAQSFQNAAQGGAYVHNLFLGGMFKYEVLDRPTPYQLPHSTQVKGCTLVYGADDRYYNNIFASIQTEPNRRFVTGLGLYNGCPDNLQEYLDVVYKRFGKCDVESFAKEKQPLYTAHNFYTDGVAPYDRDHTAAVCDKPSDAVITVEEDGGVYLEMTLDASFDTLSATPVDTERLGIPRIAEERYENPDCTPVTVDCDLFGKARGEHPTVGPIEGLASGRVRILIAKCRKI